MCRSEGHVKSLLLNADPSEGKELHTLVVQVAIVGALASGIILGSIGLATGDQRMVVETWAPFAAALFFIGQMLFRKPNALATTAVGTAIVIFTFPMVGHLDTMLGAAMAVVAMGTVASLFVVRRHLAFLVVGAFVMVWVPVFWTGSLSAGIAAGLTMSISFVIASASFMAIRRQALDVDQRFRWLFDRAPVALIEQDWAGALSLVDDLVPLDADDLRRTLTRHPELIDSIIAQVKVVRANEAASRFLHDARAMFTGGNADRPLTGEDRSAWTDRIVDMWLGKPMETFDCRLPDDSDLAGTWLEVKTIRVGNSRRPRVILAASDVTVSRRESADLADLVKEKDAFVATVSHELRTPLTAVVGLANEVLEADDLSAEEAEELLRMVVSQANEISYLVEDLLVGARTQIGTVTVTAHEVDLLSETEAVLAAVGADIPLDSSQERPLAIADPIRVRQIVRNLIINAQRYGGPKSRVVAESADGTVYLEVRDNGTPLPKDDQIRIFEPYTRAHHRPGVTGSVGLGLSVSRQLAHLMDGDLVYDHDGTEAVFRLTLPAAPVRVTVRPHAHLASLPNG